MDSALDVLENILTGSVFKRFRLITFNLCIHITTIMDNNHGPTEK